MFEVHCPHHGTRVLLSERRIGAIENTPHGIVLSWRCWCGHDGRTVTGRRRGERAPAPCPDAAA